MYQNKNLWEKSNNIFEKFLKIKGPNTAAYSAMAWNNMTSGKNEQAKVLYEKVLGLKPNNQESLVNLARIYYLLGKKDTSRSYIKRALKLNLSKVQANDLAQLLKKISTP